MKYRIVREGNVYYPEYAFWILPFWERFVTGPYGCEHVSFTTEIAARLFIECESRPRVSPDKKVVWRSK